MQVKFYTRHAQLHLIFHADMHSDINDDSASNKYLSSNNEELPLTLVSLEEEE